MGVPVAPVTFSGDYRLHLLMTDNTERFDRASELARSGETESAAALYRDILTSQPKHLAAAKALAEIVEAGRAADADELLAFCRERLSTFKCPRSVVFVDDLGRNTMGKVNKRRLRAPYWSSPG